MQLKNEIMLHVIMRHISNQIQFDYSGFNN